MELWVTISDILFKLFTLLMGPYGALIIAVLFNILLVLGLFNLAQNYIEQMKAKDKLIAAKDKIIEEKDSKLAELLGDLKLLVIKSQLSADDFKKLVESQFFKPSEVDPENIEE